MGTESVRVKQGKAQRPWASKFKPPHPIPSPSKGLATRYCTSTGVALAVPRVPCLCAPFPVRIRVHGMVVPF